MVDIKFLHPNANGDHVGLIPMMLNEADPRPAREQLDRGYLHGGGWHPLQNFTLGDDNVLHYPSDPPFRPLAEMHLHDETILIYESAFVAIIQKDRSFEVARMD